MSAPEQQRGQDSADGPMRSSTSAHAARWTRGARALARHNAVAIVFAVLVTFQLGVATVSMHAQSAMRAYVTGESLYSKGQKDALLYLQAYLISHADADYQRFLANIVVPQGDNMARLAMQQAEPDFARARQGFLAARNHPSDIDSMIWLFRWGQHVPFMARAIAVWTQADESVEELRLLVTRARTQILAGRFGSPEEMAMRARTPALNERLTLLESAFSDQLGEAARTLQLLLLAVNVVVTVLLITAGGRYMLRTTQAQRRNETKFRELVDAVGDAILACNNGHELVIFNQAAQRMFGCEARAALGQPISRFLRGALADILTPTGPQRNADPALRLNAVRFDGAAVLLEASVAHLTTVTGVLTIVTCRDVTERHAAQERERDAFSNRNLELIRKTHTDALTGLPNKAALELALEHLFASASRGHPSQFTVLFLDLDGFKTVNDTLGHMAGDELLQHVGRRIKQAIRAGDEVFRISGDEFVVVASADDDPHVGAVLSDRIVAALRKAYVLDGETLAQVTVSVGVANFPDDGLDARALLMAADAAMYCAKRSGKDSYRVGAPK